jgi:cytochrome c-type biogenesis protein
MAFPLFVMALLWDVAKLGERRVLRARVVRLRLAGRTVVTNTVNLAVALGFLVMGGFVIYLANSGRMTGGPGFQVAVGRQLAGVFRRIEAWTAPVPEPVLGVALLLLAGVFVYITLTDRRRRPSAAGEQGQPTCHDQACADETPSVEQRSSKQGSR